MRDIWAAVGLAESWSLLGLFFLVAALLRSLDLEGCTLFDCGGELSISADVVLTGAIGLGALFGASLMAALRSGWTTVRAVLQATAAFLAFGVVLVQGERYLAEVVDGYGPPLVAALGVQGLIAMRPPSRRAFRAGAAAVTLAVALSVAAESLGATVALALLVLPAIGLAHTLFVPLPESARRDVQEHGS